MSRDLEEQLAELDDFSEFSQFQSMELATLIGFHDREARGEEVATAAATAAADQLEFPTDQPHILEFLFPESERQVVDEDLPQDDAPWTWHCKILLFFLFSFFFFFFFFFFLGISPFFFFFFLLVPPDTIAAGYSAAPPPLLFLAILREFKSLKDDMISRFDDLDTKMVKVARRLESIEERLEAQERVPKGKENGRLE